MTGQHDYGDQDQIYNSNTSYPGYPTGSQPPQPNDEKPFPLYDNPPPPPSQDQYQTPPPPPPPPPPPTAQPPPVYAPSPESAEGGHHAGVDMSPYTAGNSLEENEGSIVLGFLLGLGAGFFFSFYGFFLLTITFQKKFRKGLIVGISVGCIADIALAIVIIVNYSSIFNRTY